MTGYAQINDGAFQLPDADDPDRMICRLLVADHCGAGQPTHFDVPHRRLTEEALVLAVKLTRALMADFERRARGIE